MEDKRFAIYLSYLNIEIGETNELISDISFILLLFLLKFFEISPLTDTTYC